MREIAARRYAKALIQLGQEDGKYELYGEQLKAFHGILEESADLRAVMENPIYNQEQKKAIFDAIQDKLVLAPLVMSFITLLIDKRRMGFFSEIVRCYDRLVDEAAGRLRAQVISAVTLPEASVQAIQDKLASMTGKEVILSVEEDPELMGGVVTQVGDMIYDGSIRTQLRNLKETLIKG